MGKLRTCSTRYEAYIMGTVSFLFYFYFFTVTTNNTIFLFIQGGVVSRTIIKPYIHPSMSFIHGEARYTWPHHMCITGLHKDKQNK